MLSLKGMRKTSVRWSKIIKAIETRLGIFELHEYTIGLTTFCRQDYSASNV